MSGGELQARAESLVAAREYGQAEALCQQALASGRDAGPWLRMLFGVCFLNEGDAEAQYRRAPAHAREWVRVAPGDADAHFWLGYVHAVLLDDRPLAEAGLRRALALDPGHGYAALVLGEMVEGAESIHLLERCAESQPGNVRALRALADRLERAGRPGEARAVRERMLAQPPFTETGFGILDEYANDVLTGATHAAKLPDHAALCLQVVRGERPWQELGRIGVEIEFAGGECRILYRGTLAVTPGVSDIALGFQRHRAQPDRLRAWASVVLGSTGLLDLGALQSGEDGMALLEGLWDAAASGQVEPGTAAVVARLAG